MKKALSLGVTDTVDIHNVLTLLKIPVFVVKNDSKINNF